MDRRYFVSTNGAVEGPFSPSAIEAMKEAGDIGGDAMVLGEGEPEDRWGDDKGEIWQFGRYSGDEVRRRSESRGVIFAVTS